MLKKRLGMVAAVCALLAICGVAHATLIAYEGFDYEVGTLNGKGSAGDGWTGSWGSGSNYSVVADSLTMSNLPFTPIGGSAIGRSTGNRDFDGIDLSVDATYYISFLMQRTGWGAEDGSGEWFDVHIRNSDYSRVAVWGITSGEEFHTAELGSSQAGGDAGTTDVYFIVGKIVSRSSGNDEIYLKAYSESDTIELTETSSWTVSGGQEDLADVPTRLTLWAGTDDDEDGYFQGAIDEIRIGTTWEDVVVPEPATMLLLAFGAGLVTRRKRIR